MKRATSGSSASPQRGPDHKKPRLDGPHTNSFAALSSPVTEKEKEGGEWTKVEKRKQKKVKHTEARLSVCRVHRTSRDFLISFITE